MLQIYTFTSTNSDAEEASKSVMRQTNAFLNQISESVEVKDILQSESSCVSGYDGMNDWSYSFSITLVCTLRPMGDPADLTKLRDLYESL